VNDARDEADAVPDGSRQRADVERRDLARQRPDLRLDLAEQLVQPAGRGRSEVEPDERLELAGQVRRQAAEGGGIRRADQGRGGGPPSWRSQTSLEVWAP